MKWVTWLGKVHSQWKECFARGRYRELLLTNRQYAFARFTDSQGILAAVNNDEAEAAVSIPVPFQDKTYINLKTQEPAAVENGRIQLTLKPAGTVLMEIQ